MNTLRSQVRKVLLAMRAKRLCARPLRSCPGTRGSVSLITTNYNEGETFPVMLKDWIAFAGRRPEEIVVVDGGSDAPTVEIYMSLFREGLIDKLYLMQPGHPENKKHLCFIQEYYSGLLGSGDYLFFFKQDTLPYRRGHDGWLDEAIGQLAADPRLFAVSGGSPGGPPMGPVGPDYWCLEHVSENFAIVPRRHHLAAMDLCRDFLGTGWRGRNPFAGIGPMAERCMIESAWDVYCRRHGMRVLMRRETEDWSILHANKRGAELLALRDLQRDRALVRPFLNRVAPFFTLAEIDKLRATGVLPPA